MTGIDAKRVFIALARKWHFSSVRRCNDKPGLGYTLKFLNSSGHPVNSLGKENDQHIWLDLCVFKSAKWAKMLQSLEGKTIGCGSERIKVNSIEQLVVDLELGGWLKNLS